MEGLTECVKPEGRSISYTEKGEITAEITSLCGELFQEMLKSSLCFCYLWNAYWQINRFKISLWNFCVFTWKKFIFSIDFSNDLQRKSSKMNLHFFCFIEMCRSLKFYMLNFIIF